MEADFPCNDADFEASKGEIEIKLPKDLVCKSRNRIVKMCVKPSCTRCSLHCDRDDCASCNIKEHKKCIKIDMDGATSLLNQHNQTKFDIMEKIGEMENSFFNSLYQTN